jgi:hypothetical protein
MPVCARLETRPHPRFITRSNNERDIYLEVLMLHSWRLDLPGHDDYDEDEQQSLVSACLYVSQRLNWD